MGLYYELRYRNYTMSWYIEVILRIKIQKYTMSLGPEIMVKVMVC